MATHSSILAWRIAWTEEPSGLQSVGSQRVRHDSSDLASAPVSPLHWWSCSSSYLLNGDNINTPHLPPLIIQNPLKAKTMHYLFFFISHSSVQSMKQITDMDLT